MIPVTPVVLCGGSGISLGAMNYSLEVLMDKGFVIETLKAEVTDERDRAHQMERSFGH